MQSVRLVVLGCAVVVTLGSASSNQQGQPPATGYYPTPQQAPQPGYEATPPAQAPVAYEPPPPPPEAEPAHAPAPEPAHAPAPEPAHAPAPPPVANKPPPVAEKPEPEQKRTQWVCNATGSWQKCETQGYQCYPQMTTMLGFGPDEAQARFSSETLCNTAMSRMMSANFTYRTSVTLRCKAISCSPPSSR